jgi:hypothetical protein
MHVLQIIINPLLEPKLVHALYDNELKKVTRMAVFEFDMNKENAQEIDYEEFPILVKATLKIVQSYIENLEDLADIDKEEDQEGI